MPELRPPPRTVARPQNHLRLHKVRRVPFLVEPRGRSRPGPYPAPPGDHSKRQLAGSELRSEVVVVGGDQELSSLHAAAHDRNHPLQGEVDGRSLLQGEHLSRNEHLLVPFELLLRVLTGGERRRSEDVNDAGARQVDVEGEEEPLRGEGRFQRLHFLEDVLRPGLPLRREVEAERQELDAGDLTDRLVVELGDHSSVGHYHQEALCLTVKDPQNSHDELLATPGGISRHGLVEEGGGLFLYPQNSLVASRSREAVEVVRVEANCESHRLLPADHVF
mmetsp:Transcript_51341/g.160304  ORF Transcript_51341/g.160304 Transcript_51341/m.160304 type:complete len:277 (+) Transcript_51341:2475-3305(+)